MGTFLVSQEMGTEEGLVDAGLLWKVRPANGFGRFREAPARRKLRALWLTAEI
jgi:hypothetical protein